LMQPAQDDKAIWLASKAMVQSSVVDCCSPKAASPHSARRCRTALPLNLSRKVAFSLPGSRHFLQGASQGWIG
ncbi:hypothetical protein NKH34_30710, partial [Mesorhizobium sp. M1148]